MKDGLAGARVALLPLERRHFADLARAGLYPELWKLTTKRILTEDDLRVWLDKALDDAARGIGIPFVTTLVATGEVVGSTRCMEIVQEHKRLEIGWTWITPAWQRSFVNTEAKYLMLRHAFETLGYNRVEFKTSHLNHRSQNALKRLGAVEEGTFRNHMINPDGVLRHSVYFSIIKDEWPAVKARLEGHMCTPWAPRAPDGASEKGP
jgi:RimJ/RimL family protein N-acetyltransferase